MANQHKYPIIKPKMAKVNLPPKRKWKHFFYI
jgi:hypothetical protein